MRTLLGGAVLDGRKLDTGLRGLLERYIGHKVKYSSIPINLKSEDLGGGLRGLGMAQCDLARPSATSRNVALSDV